jgi:hypothetical protein
LITELNSGCLAFTHRYLQDFFCANYLVERAGGLERDFSRHGRDMAWVEVWRQVGQLCQDPDFFALSESRDVSDSIKSIDRMISSILSHEGLSKSELLTIIERIGEELNSRMSELPTVVSSETSAEVDCSALDDSEIRLLAKTTVDVSFLGHSIAGMLLLQRLEKGSNSSFSNFVRSILRAGEKVFSPIIGVSKLQFLFGDKEKLDR